ncbi:hypothetical protein DAPPUDRAFT_336115 [Daphnia pulex]|nr:hypothetical protein DAPPUDRAFT_336115 [Daphnia pulex]|eukprot:EFX62972.1 hypothetical protein DAPPUDRAFT_336115 [Daphnia pulex]
MQTIERGNRRVMQRNKQLLSGVKTLEQEKEELRIRAKKESLETHLKTLPPQEVIFLLPN